MRILLVSYFFPPFNSIGAVRAGKMAANLARLGHDVRVLTAADQPLQATLPVELPESCIVRTPWWNVSSPAQWLAGGRRAVADRGYHPPGKNRRWWASLGAWYKALVHVPDGQIGWYPYSIAAGDRLLSQWKPDWIYASGLPATSLLIGARLANRWKVPWLAELRDLWVDPYRYPHPRWRARIEQRWERRVLRTAAGLVTVSEPLAEHLRNHVGRPTAVVFNGFDPADYPTDDAVELPPNKQFHLNYTGMVYEGHQDVTPLLKALHLLGDRAEAIQVRFFGRYLQPVREAVERFGLSRHVAIHDQVPYLESLALQRSADALLLLLWTDVRQQGVLTGKLFEYLGARRQILAVGPEPNAAADLIRQRGCGLVSNDPQQIATWLDRQLDRKLTAGRSPDLQPSVATGFSRFEQAQRLEAFLYELTPQSSQHSEQLNRRSA